MGETAAAARVRTGGCPCGAVRYEITGEVGAVSFCHCGQCRRQHGHVGAYTGFPRTALRLVREDGLSWYRSSDAARRGFCGVCGGALFWDPIGEARIDVAAGSLDAPTGLTSDRHIFVADKGDYYDIGDDGLPRYGQGRPDP